MTTRAGQWKRQCLAACIALTAVCSAADAQQSKPKYDEKILFQDAASGSAGASVHSWSVGDGVRVSQQTYPIALTYPASDRILVSLSAVPASTQQGGGAITGVPETRLSVTAVLPGEKLFLMGTVSAPTGVTRLTAEQTETASAIAQPALGFRMPTMGHGLNTTLGIAYASAVSRGIVFGFGGAASFKGNYEPVAPTAGYAMRYAPGNELSANVGVDLRNGMKTDRFSADYTVTYYFADKINGERFFRTGIKAAFVLVGTHIDAMGVHQLQARAELRARNVNVIGGKEEESASAQQYLLQYSLTLPLREKVSLTASAEARMMSSDQFPLNGEVLTTGGGTIGVLSAECRYAAARWCVVSTQLGVGFGSITYMNSDRHAVGFDAGVGLKFLF